MSTGQSERDAFQQKSPQTHTGFIVESLLCHRFIRVDIFSALMFASCMFLQCLICNKRINHRYRKEKREVCLMKGVDIHKIYVKFPHISHIRASMYVLRQTAYLIKFFGVETWD